MSDPIVYVDRSQIRAGKIDEVKAAMKELTEFADANEPQLISYGFFLAEDETRMTCIAVHPDSASLGFHMDVAGPVFRKFRGLIDMERIDVYGPVHGELIDVVKQKAEMLGRGNVIIHHRHVGFSRFAD
ncbi:MAG TPA: hypothetical protein VFA34_08150 [Actinomycetota bacterium]|jgi:hypothetical protein|nr:hypothetical protein [Actinomycetota bacterium]